MSVNWKSGASALALAALVGTPSYGFAEEAEEVGTPRVEVTIPVEIQNDYAYEADDPDAELNDLYTTIEPEIAVFLTEALSIQAGLVFEPVVDPDPGEDRAFENHGLYAEQLFIEFAPGGFSLIAGKFNPAFGAAWDRAPGVYGTDFAEDYELVERIGFGGSVDFGEGDWGEHSLTAATFFADTTFMSGSAFKSRGRTNESDGGVSNTEDFSSFSISLDSEEVPALGGLGYTLGFLRQEGGEGDPEDETGYVLGLFGSYELGAVTAEPILEWAHFENTGGAEEDTDYLTAGVAFLHGPWNLSISYTGRFTDPDDPITDDVDDMLFQASAGYEFDCGLTADIGYRFSEEDESDTHVVGLLLAYEFGFTVP